ncbi:hypothetical protein TNCV_1287231 [Trichonephila clavipes]|nr:hypothetical protein TNCV_1287231 [Trichonephila clavipes]
MKIQLKPLYCPMMCDTLRRLAATRYCFPPFSKDMNSVMMFMQTYGLFVGLLCKAVFTSAIFVLTMDSLTNWFGSATDSVSRNRCTKRVMFGAFGAVSAGYFY